MTNDNEADQSYKEEQRTAYQSQNTRENDEVTPSPSPFRVGKTTRSREDIQSEVPTHLIIPDDSTANDPHYARKFAYRVPTPAQPTTMAQKAVSRELAERNENPDIPTIQINGQIFEASRVINANLSRNMVEMIDKHGLKYRISSTEILLMAKNHHFTAIEREVKGTKYYYLTEPKHNNKQNDNTI